MSSVMFAMTIKLARPMAIPAVSLRKAVYDIVLAVPAKKVPFVFAVGIGGEVMSRVDENRCISTFFLEVKVKEVGLFHRVHKYKVEDHQQRQHYSEPCIRYKPLTY